MAERKMTDALLLYEFICKECGYLSLGVKSETKDMELIKKENRDKCFLCGSSDILYKSEAPEIFKEMEDDFVKYKRHALRYKILAKLKEIKSDIHQQS